MMKKLFILGIYDNKFLLTLNRFAMPSCIVILLIGIYRQVKVLFSRLDIGIGLTDEAYAILHTIDRGVYGQTSSTPQFADLTSILMKFANFDIRMYRLLGYILLLGISLLLCNAIARRCDPTQHKLFIIWKCLAALFLILLLPASFRYLLVTPGYQWLVLLTSILIVIVLSELTKETKKSNVLILIITALLVLTIEIARFTSGFATWVLVNAYILKKAGIKSFSVFNLGVVVSNVLYAIFNFEAIKANLDRLIKIKEVDPTGASFINEIYDISKTVILISILLLLPALILNIFLSFKQRLPQRKYYTAVIVSLSAIFFIIHYLILNARQLLHILVFLPLIGIGFLHTILYSKFNYLLFALTLLPIVSQFGSNISSNFLIMPVFITGFLFLFLDSVTIKNQFDLKQKLKNALALICVVILTLSLTILQIQFSNTSYENGYGSKLMKRDPRSGLLYDSEKMKNINKLRFQIKEYQNIEKSRILDLSNWHPGVIFYVGGRQLPVSTHDRVFNDTLFNQVEQTLKQSGYNSNLPLIVETTAVTPKYKCQKLREYQLNVNMRAAIKALDFNPFVREIGIYLSVSDDLTLYPKNISLMIPCTPES